jgi:hypothetical protein
LEIHIGVDRLLMLFSFGTPISEGGGRADNRMQDETARVEDALLDRDATTAIMNCFVQSSGSHLEKVIDRYVPITQQS